MLNSVQEIRDNSFIIDDMSYVSMNVDNFSCNEKFGAAQSYINGSKRLDYCDIVNFILVKYNYIIDDNRKFFNSKITAIPKEYNFNHLIPPIENFKEVIDEYCAAMDPIKLRPLQNQITILNQKLASEDLKFQAPIIQFQNIIKSLSNSAKSRIHNQLSYKLGQAMIVNSKSILGYIRMPFVLLYIYDKHKQEQKIYQEKIKKDPSLKLPPLETYPDYKEALKEKECFTYKLGQALIQANKTWYGGGYIKLLLEIRKLKKGNFTKKGLR
ncbi:sugar transferase [Campylobacter jejuni]|nr:sugar transferase [Campylobacter jejuni]